MQQQHALENPVARMSDSYIGLPIAAVLVVGALLVGFQTLAVTVGTLALFVIPGFLVARSFATPIAAVIYGFPLGYTLTSLLLMVVVALAGWNFLWIALAYTACLVALQLLRWYGQRGNAGPVTQALAPAELPLTVAAVAAITVALLYFPLSRAGALTPSGYAFTGLFGHDFILRGVDSVALANAVPSDNYFFAGVKTYNYYLLWYMLPATVYNLLGQRAPITDVIALIDLVNIPIFAALLYYALVRFARSTGSASAQSPRLVLIFAVLFLLSYSYHWIFFAITHLGDVSNVPVLAHAAEQMGPVSTSWLKDFLFQPHCVLALMQLLLVMQLALGPEYRGRGIWIGLLLGSLLLTDVVIFLVSGTAFGIWYLFRGQLRRRLVELSLIAVAAGAVIGSAFLLSVFTIPEYSNKIVLAPQTTAIVTLPALLLLCLGPLAIFGPLSLRMRGWFKTQDARLLVILLFVSLFYMLFVSEVVEGNVFLRKSLMTLRLPLFIFSALYLSELWSSVKWRGAVLAITVLAVPTLLTDLYATTQTSDPRATMYITKDEMEAADWLRTNTGANAVVQSLIEYHGGIFDYSLTICFAERKAALGLWQMAYQRYPNREAISRRVRQIQALFSTTSDEERAALTRDLRIQYVLVGPRERARFPEADLRFAADVTHFKVVHRSPSVTIFQAVSSGTEAL